MQQERTHVNNPKGMLARSVTTATYVSRDGLEDEPGDEMMNPVASRPLKMSKMLKSDKAQSLKSGSESVCAVTFVQMKERAEAAEKALEISVKKLQKCQEVIAVEWKLFHAQTDDLEKAVQEHYFHGFEIVDKMRLKADTAQADILSLIRGVIAGDGTTEAQDEEDDEDEEGSPSVADEGSSYSPEEGSQ
ncbi:hypothetical protein T484DRAFT_1755741 [Baffinella frigidus]|nr:hypothetical protein T484DRAFT_1755741 [Cryptophyta sp. CCMP2293]